jgi:hypothetical protein
MDEPLNNMPHVGKKSIQRLLELGLGCGLNQIHQVTNMAMLTAAA